MMRDDTTDTVIIGYLQDTVAIRGAFFDANELNDNDGSSRIAPWSIAQICANLDNISEDDVVDFVSRRDNIFELDEIGGQKCAVVLRTGSVIPGSEYGASIKSARIIDSLESTSVAEAFSILLLAKVTELTGKMSHWVKKEDAIFGIKNSLMIPDDFMPPSWMSVVENDDYIRSPDILDDLGTIRGEKSLYIYSSVSKGKGVKPYFLYPRRSSGIEVTVSETEIASRISNNFSRLQSSEDFEVFTASRSIKSAIFNLQTRNTRELKKPMFDRVKLSLMIRDGLVSEREEKYFLNDSVDLAELAMFQSEYKREATKLAEMWLNSTLK
jgi:hypothetical protein